MNIVEIIDKKINNNELTESEIYFLINGYVDKLIPDYQMSALLMAIKFNGLSDQETTFLTTAMINSGDIMSYSNINKIIVDKHSTGGVGDKTSIVLIPLLASLDFAVSKMSGRGLGYTGGTIDKLESLSGFTVEISEEQLKHQVQKIGCAIIGQTIELVPADKKIYALRDVTATVDSIPLMASSIMSKKLALGAEIIVLDVKYGSGAFVKTVEEAESLAKKMVAIGKLSNKKTIACITSMQQPLGESIGNAIEVQEAIDTLKGQGNQELKQLCIDLAIQFIQARDQSINENDAYKMVENKLTSKLAYHKFIELITEQNSSEEAIEQLSISQLTTNLIANQNGYVHSINSAKVGKASMILGAGRLSKDDQIDLSVGIKLKKKVGDFVKKGDTIAIIYYNDESKLDLSFEILRQAYCITHKKTNKIKVIEKIIK